MDIKRVDVWAAGITDEVGSLGGILTGLKDAGANLDFVISRRTAGKPGEGVVFVTPLEGDDVVKAARELGFNVATSIQAVRVEGDDAPGVGAALTAKLAESGINLRGFSAAVTGSKFIAYVGFDTSEDAEKAIELLA
jgi:hypothetical protein